MKNNRTTFILIRGLLREQRHWGQFIPSLKQQFPTARIISLDIPGNGSLYQQTSPNTIAGLTESLRQQLPHRSQLHLIAISMGGMIAIDWMNCYPTEIKSTVLINSSLANYSPFYQRLKWQNYPAIFKQIFQPAQQIEPLILNLTSNKYQGDTELLKSWGQWRKQFPVSTKSAFNQLWAAARFKCSTKPLHPLLIAASKKDKLVDYRCSLALQKQWQSDYIEHDSAGHDLPLDDPDWMAQSIHHWHQEL